MTRVIITDGNELCAISMMGHANHESGGGDIVCAACSVLIQSLANTLYVMGMNPNWYQRPGEAHVRFTAGRTLHRDIRARGAFDMARVGLEMLARAYPENVKIEH